MQAAVAAALLAGMLGQDPREDIRKNLDVYLKRWAEEYVSYIMTDEERRVFAVLPGAPEKLAFIESFWQRRDPTERTPENEFREQFAARFAYANTQFRTARPGWKTDRGRIYILLGPPTYIDRNPMGRSSMERPSEVWTYMNLHHPDLPSSMEIQFVDFFGNGDFEIVSNLDAANLRPTGFLPSFSDLDYFGQRRAHPVEYGEEGPRRVDEGSLASERFNFLQDLRSAESPPEARPQPLRALVGTSVTFATLPFDLATAVFSDPSGGGKIPAALALRYDNLMARRRSGRAAFSLDVYAELRDPQGKEVARLDRVLNFDLSEQEMTSDSLRYLFALVAPAGDYRLHFMVRDNFGQSVGAREEPVAIPAGSPALSLSSLLLADNVERLEGAALKEQAEQPESPFTFGDVRVIPNPSRVFRQGAPMYVYFQAYGLALSEGKNSMRVEYTFRHADQMLWKPIPVSFLPTEKSERGVFSTFDTTRFPPGRYTLAVKVEDLVAGRVQAAEVTFLIR
jgi:GWxTD domain-containing protein